MKWQQYKIYIYFNCTFIEPALLSNHFIDLSELRFLIVTIVSQKYWFKFNIWSLAIVRKNSIFVEQQYIPRYKAGLEKASNFATRVWNVSRVIDLLKIPTS